MSSANEKAEVILIVIKRLIKWILLSLLAAGAIFVSFIYVLDYKSSIEQKKKNELESKVKINLFYANDGLCDTTYPYAYQILNESNKIVESVEMTIKIFKKGFSKELNRYTSLTEDKILKPGEGWQGCFRAISDEDYNQPVTEKDVEFEISYKDIKFKESSN